MSDRKHFISIWFFIGLLLGIYGILITSSGVYDIFYPPARRVVLSNVHAAVWWGALLIILGAIYIFKFFPGKDK